MVPAAFFVADGDAFLATAHTRGPWSVDHQHGGPPAALMARAAEQLVVPEGFRIVRIAFEILRPVPIARLHVDAQWVHPGRNVRRVSVRLRAGDKVVTEALAVAVRTVEMPEIAPTPSAHPAAPPEDCAPFTFPFFSDALGYQKAMDLRIAKGAFGKGPTQAWLRMRHPLLADEVPSPLCRTTIAADSGNGVSPILDWRKHGFINPDLTVSVFRDPVDEWICLDAQTEVQPNGVGLASAILRDRTGAFGRSTQSLLIRPR